MAMLVGFRPLPVFNAVSGDHMMTATSNAAEWLSLDDITITRTVADVEFVLRSIIRIHGLR